MFFSGGYQMEDKVSFLKSIPLFEELDDEALGKLSDLVFMRKFPRKFYLFYEGEPGDTLFIIKEGKVKLILTHEDQEKIVQVVNEGRLFPETALDGGTYPVTCETIEETLVYAMRSKDFKAFLAEYPEFMLKVLEYTCKKIRRTFRQIRNLAMKNARERLASKIYSLSVQFGKKSEEGCKITIPLTIEDVAKMIGTTRETANRILLEFKKDKIIKFESHFITLIDEGKLKVWF